MEDPQQEVVTEPQIIDHQEMFGAETSPEEPVAEPVDYGREIPVHLDFIGRQVATGSLQGDRLVITLNDLGQDVLKQALEQHESLGIALQTLPQETQ